MRARSVLATLALVALAGCSPVETTLHYNPGDGIQVELGNGIQADNLMFVSDGEQAALLGAVSNSGSTPVTVELTLTNSDDPIDVELAAADVVYFSPTHESIVVEGLTAQPGDVATIYLSTSETGVITADVPVLDTSLPQYADVLG